MRDDPGRSNSEGSGGENPPNHFSGSNPVPHLGKVSERLVKETLSATARFHHPVGGDDECHVRLIMPDLVQSDVSVLTKMKLGRRSHLGHTRDMRYECHSAT
jgi:hypothetical protein